MSKERLLDPTGRFTGLAEGYAQYRPGYPDAALDWILTRCGLGPGTLLVDVGCGTGISSRSFARRGLRVIGLEPNADMRRRAEAEAVPPGVPAPVYRAGRAEATGLGAGMADVVLAAQAFHWFDPVLALCEFSRILKPGGWAVLLWNERDETDPFTAAYGSVVRSTSEGAAMEAPRGRAGQALLTSALFSQGEVHCFDHEQFLDEKGVQGRAFSISYAPREPAAAQAFADALRGVFARFQQGGKVTLRYVTSGYLAQSVAKGVQEGERNHV